MLKTVLTLSSLSLLAIGCGHTLTGGQLTAAEQAEQDSPKSHVTLATQLEDTLPTSEQGRPAATPWSLSPGDTVVYRFSGSYRSSPLTVTHQVVKKTGRTLLLDMTLEEEGRQQRLRLRMKTDDSGRRELVSVAQFEGQLQRPFGIAAYERLMSRVMLFADENESQIGRRDMKLTLSNIAVPCTKVSYRVRVNNQLATMHNFESPQFPWGDLGGEIISSDGTVLYRAEIIELTPPTTSNNAAIAIHAEPDEYDELDIYDE